jgi:SM-20-related protein
MVITLRGYSRAKDGRIHTDSKSKMATILIYFNDEWVAETGKLRILRSEDMDDYVAEVAPNAGTMIAFKVTDNCWHGYPAFEGTRQSIQINFVEDDKAATKHGRRHGWTAKLKKLFS